MIGIVNCVENDKVSALKWQKLLGGRSNALILEEFLNNTEEISSKFKSLLLVGLEPLQYKQEHQQQSNIEEILQNLAEFESPPPVPSLTTEEILKISNIKSLISLYNERQQRIVGIGAGSLLLCEVLGGEVAKISKLTSDLEEIDMEKQPIHLGMDKIECANEKLYIPRLNSSMFTKLPPTSKEFAKHSLTDNNESICFRVFSLNNEGIEIVSSIGLNACPEIEAEEVIDEWMSLLDQYLLLSSAEAMETIDSMTKFAEDESSVIGSSMFISIIKSFLLYEDEVVKKEVNDGESEEVISLKKLIAQLESRVYELEIENAKLREHQNSTPIQKNSKNDQKYNVRAFLAGMSIESGNNRSLEEVEIAENSLHRLEHFSSEVQDVENSSQLLSLAYTNEGNLLYVGTDCILRVKKEEEETREEFVKLPAPPIFIVISPYSIPSQIAIGMLSGSIERFTTSAKLVLDFRTILPSPHKKHITGLIFDPIGGINNNNRFISISRDGLIVKWNGKNEVDSAFLQENFSPECSCGVILNSNKSYAAIARRDNCRVTLLPFDEESEEEEEQRKFFDLEEEQVSTFTPLAMCSFKSLPIIAVATDKSSIILYDVENNVRLRTFGGHVCGEFARPSISFDFTGKFLACTSVPNDIFLFQVNCPSREPIIFKEHTAMVRSICFQANQKGDLDKFLLTSGGFDKRVKIRHLQLK